VANEEVDGKCRVDRVGDSLLSMAAIAVIQMGYMLLITISRIDFFHFSFFSFIVISH
jgi:hypothetical protein